VLHRKHDPEAAIDFTNRALAIDPDYSYAHSILGSVYDRMGRYDDAFREFEKALAIDEKNRVENSTLFNNRGYAFLRRGDYIAAIRDFRDALRINKDFRLAESNLNFALELRKGGREPELAPPPSEKR
jgi:tetratricopeptide (TPR) repeat protein